MEMFEGIMIGVICGTFIYFLMFNKVAGYIENSVKFKKIKNFLKESQETGRYEYRSIYVMASQLNMTTTDVELILDANGHVFEKKHDSSIFWRYVGEEA